MDNRLKQFKKNLPFLLMVLPGALWFIIFKYLPMFGTVIAFKDYHIDGNGFFSSIRNSEWIGFKNFEFLFKTKDAYVITRNTLVYNLIFIFLGLVFAVFLAIALSEINNKRASKVYQTGMFLPYFLSWVVVGYFTFIFLSGDKGIFNHIRLALGMKPLQWYSETKRWPGILVFMNIWKGVGYSSVVYLAAILGIDKTYYEAAMLDGASKWQQIKNITIPMITPLIIVLTLMAIGRIFYADFGLFYQIPRDSGLLYPVTDVIDTYVYRSLTTMGDMGMSVAAGLYQSFVGFILVMISNKVVKKIDNEYALF